MSRPDDAVRADRTVRAILGLAVGVLVVAPPLVAPWPPVLDLPQQLAQIRLVDDALAPGSPYRIDAGAPNKLAYPLLAAALAVGGSSWGPRLAMILCGAVVAVAVVALARRLGRPPENAALATLFLYTGVYYGGFLSFLVGGAAFAAWLALLSGETEHRPPVALALRLVAALALYWAHLLWIAAAALVALFPGPRRGGARARLAALAVLAPFALAGAAWYAAAASGAPAEPPRYEDRPLERLLAPSAWGRIVVCGLRGPWELALLAALGLWAAVALATERRAAGSADPWLARIALIFALLGTLLPDAFGFTVLLSHRFWPWAAILALLALPAPAARRPFGVAAVVALVLVHAGVTTRAWRAHARDDLRGFAAALAAVPDGDRLLGLDFERVSPRFWIGPYFHVAAYAQLDREVALGYSFAGAPTSLVVAREGAPRPAWTPGLEHQPWRLAARDLESFDHLLVHARDGTPEAIAALSGRLTPVAGESPWRLLAVRSSPGEGP